MHPDLEVWPSDSWLTAVGRRGSSMQTVCLWSSGNLFQTPRSKWPRQILLICSLYWGCKWFGYSSIYTFCIVMQISICWVVASYKLTTIPLSLQPCCLLINLYLEALTDEGDGLQLSSYIQKLMDWFLLFTVGPLLLSVKGIIDLAQMPPTILLPHPGGTGTPTLERIAYLTGPQPPFPPRAFNPTSISQGEDPSLPHPYTPCALYLPCHDRRFCKSAALRWPDVAKVSCACLISQFYSCWEWFPIKLPDRCTEQVMSLFLFLVFWFSVAQEKKNQTKT